MKTSVKIIFIVLVAILLFVAVFSVWFFVSFKTIYKDIIYAESEKNSIDASLVFAIIKAESKLNANAKSGAGAVGLMQVMLPTANYILSLEGESEITEKELFDPETNIQIGTKYLAYLIDKFEIVDVAICAYNAGETVVRGWLKDKNYSDDEKTLKEIPFNETLNYLKRVKFNQQIYKKIL